MEIIIGSILDAVFSSLAESVGLSSWLRDQLQRNPEKLAFRTALTQALVDATQSFPGRDLRYFAEVLRDFGSPLLARTLQPASPLPTATELTEAWLNHLNLDSMRYYKADFERFAALFLDSLYIHLENQQPLHWIAQLRTHKVTADAVSRNVEVGEQSATLLAALGDELKQLNRQLEHQSTLLTGGGASIQGNVQAGGDFIGRDRITIRNYFTDGLARLHIDYSARIEEFLLEYLGSRRQRVPFGGRTTQLAALNAWLADRSAPPYYLMTAEAGRGKSALVCRWQTQALTLSDVEVIFIPISIRFETATQDVVFATLAARLAALHGETMQAAALSADQWRATCQSYLRRQPPDGKQLLLILDGLDEATGWTPGRGLFPGDPPDGLRVVVTARQRAGESGPQGWVAVLGWNDDRLARKVMLTGLDRTGVQEALVSMGNPLDRLATQVDVVRELYRLTEGDPLLVRLYVDALVGKGMAAAYLRVEELATIQPGLQGYFDRWWSEQVQQWHTEGRDPIIEQKNLLMLLNAIAAALGPIMLTDLAIVSNLTNGLLVRGLAQIVDRWVIGDGKSHGYTFSHPKLGYYFWEQLGETEQSVWNARFTNWGAKVLHTLNNGALAAKAVPRYIVQHYADHLERSSAPATQFYALISDGWRRAWEEVDVSYSGFLHDIMRAQAQARYAYNPAKPGRAEALVQQLKASLCYASVVASSEKMWPALLTQAVIYSLYTPKQALAIIQLMHEGQKRAMALESLAPHLPQALFKDALAVVRTIRSEADCARALSALALHLPQGLLEEALAIAWAIKSNENRVKVLDALILRLPQSQQYIVLAEALTAARAISYDWTRANALSALVPHLSQAEKAEVLAEALAAARAIEDKGSRVSMLAKLVPHLPHLQQTEVLEEALATARTIKEEWKLAQALGALAPHLPQAQQAVVLAQALAAVRTLKNNSWERTYIWKSLAPYLPQDLLPKALAIAKTITPEYNLSYALTALFPYLPQELLAEALAVVRAVENKGSRVSMLAELVPHLPHLQQTKVLEEALATARTIEDEGSHANALAKLVSYLPQTQQSEVLTKQLAVARTIADKRSYANALGALAPHLPETQQDEVLTEALMVVRTIRNEWDFAAALKRLVPYIPQGRLEEVLTIACVIRDLTKYINVISALIPRLPSTQQSSVWKKVLATIRSIEDENDRTSVLADLAPHLPEAQQALVLDEALTAARAIKAKPYRSDHLRMLIPYLSQEQYAQVLVEAFAVAKTIEDQSDRTFTLGELALCLPKGFLTEAYESDQAHILGEMELGISQAQQAKILANAFIAVKTTRHKFFYTYALSALAFHLPQSLLAEAFAAARTIGGESVRAIALSELAPHLPQEQQNLVLAEALTAASMAEHDSNCVDALVVLAPRLPQSQLAKALAIASTISNEWERGDTLDALASKLCRWGIEKPETAFLSYSRAIQRLSYHPRPQFLHDIKGLIPFILSLAGDEAPEAAAGIFRALRDVCTWWP